ncbi:hypothetical protein ABZP36_030495 [Zizania latifolia]
MDREVEVVVVVEVGKQPGESKEGSTLVLVVEDGVEVHISKAGAQLSQTLCLMTVDGCPTERIPIQGVCSDVLKLIVEYCEKHAPYFDPEASAQNHCPIWPFPIELPPSAFNNKYITFIDPNADPHGLKAFNKEFFSVDNSTLFEIMLLNIENLWDDACSAVADKMKRKSAEEIRKIFNIKNGYTPEEEA